MAPPSVDALAEVLYAASACGKDQSRVSEALDQLLAFVERSPPSSVVALFEKLDASRLVRAVGQTLLAAAKSPRFREARRSFLPRFAKALEQQRAPDKVIRRVEKEVEQH